MEPQYQPPSKTARLSYHVTARMRSEDYDGSEMRNEGSITSGSAEGPAPAGLGLKLGLGLGLSRGEHGGPKPSSAFTFLQMRELEHQALIYKYIEAGVAVPDHLILPVWNSVSSLRRLNGGLHELYNPNLFEYKSSGEAEPSRCRRTDGKKWRCGKDVVPNEKYCERHIHRGRHRSKKRVEPPQLSTTATSINLSIVPPPAFHQQLQ